MERGQNPRHNQSSPSQVSEMQALYHVGIAFLFVYFLEWHHLPGLLADARKEALLDKHLST